MHSRVMREAKQGNERQRNWNQHTFTGGIAAHERNTFAPQHRHRRRSKPFERLSMICSTSSCSRCFHSALASPRADTWKKTKSERGRRASHTCCEPLCEWLCRLSAIGAASAGPVFAFLVIGHRKIDDLSLFQSALCDLLFELI